MTHTPQKSNSHAFARKWIRKYVESLHDPKVVSLSDSQYRDWDRLLLIAAKSADGTLPSLKAIACDLRCTESNAFAAIDDLVNAGLIDVISYIPMPVYKPHGWDQRQFLWDSGDPTAKERMKRMRERKSPKRNRNGNGRVTVGVTENPSESVSTSYSVASRKCVNHEKNFGNGQSPSAGGGDGSVRVGGGK